MGWGGGEGAVPRGKGGGTLYERAGHAYIVICTQYIKVVLYIREPLLQQKCGGGGGGGGGGGQWQINHLMCLAQCKSSGPLGTTKVSARVHLCRTLEEN